MTRRFSPVFICLLLVISHTPANGGIFGSSDGQKEGTALVELRNASESLGDVQFNHPYFITEERLYVIFSSLSYREKGVVKKKARKRIFLNKELREIVPIIVESLSKADPRKIVFVSITSESGFLQDRQNTFSLFVLGKELHVAFSQVRTRKELPPSFKDWKVSGNTPDPTTVKSHGFWELVPGKGQRLKEDNDNWLIIDVENKVFEPVARVKEEEITTSPLIEERLRRLEEKMGLSSAGKEDETAQATPSEPPKKVAPSDTTLTDRMRELKTMLDEELISFTDYEKKKREILQEEPPEGKSIPDILKELKDLKDVGLITEKDFEQWKAKLLEKF